MQNREAGEFLTSRRARVTPEMVNLPGGPNRRVAGLRRSEVALLAGVSVEYYARLEQGNVAGVSDSVLHAVARALRLDDAERDHLLDLSRTANASPTHPESAARAAEDVQPATQYVLDAMATIPAVIRNARLDLLASNALWRALYAPMYDRPDRSANLARFAFLNRAVANEFYPDWRSAAEICVEILRVETGRRPHDQALRALIDELSTGSADFARFWASHEVRNHAAGVKRFNHPAVGALELAYEELQLASNPDLTLLAYSPAPGSASEDALTALSARAGLGVQEPAGSICTAVLDSTG